MRGEHPASRFGAKEPRIPTRKEKAPTTVAALLLPLPLPLAGAPSWLNAHWSPYAQEAPKRHGGGLPSLIAAHRSDLNFVGQFLHRFIVVGRSSQRAGPIHQQPSALPLSALGNSDPGIFYLF